MRRRRPNPPVKARGNLTHARDNGGRLPGVRRSELDEGEAMAAYDLLPPRLRAALRCAPFKVNPKQALDCYLEVGEQQALRIWEQSLNTGLNAAFRETGLRTGVCRD